MMHHDASWSSMMHQLIDVAARRRKSGGSGGAAAHPEKLIIHGWVTAARAPLDTSREKKKKETIGPGPSPSSMRAGISYSVRGPPLSDILIIYRLYM